ncbi:MULTISPECIES: LacI family DNA-binding transcriptional regulator [Arthrobacter]|nr:MULTISPECIES: LacI family DNA-binding transcriptional regulator [Arthrobacter]MBT8160924.1 LacI family transcriptional regulator [Arthrobacter sp. GN70]
MTEGPRRATMADVAVEADVSKALVSLVYRKPEKVSPERRRRVHAAAERLGFRPNWVASSLSAYKGSFIGILVSNLHNPLFATIVDTVRTELDAAGRYGLMSSAVIQDRDGTTRTDRRIVNAFEDLNASALLVVGVTPDVSELQKLRPDIPIVVAAAAIDELPRAASVRSDNELGMRAVVEHLVSLGHTKIAHLGGAGGPASQRRAEAYAHAMTEFGLEENIHVESAEFDEQSGFLAAQRVLDRRPGATALACVNDLVALGAMNAASQRGLRIPDDVAITGYDNTFLAGIEAISLTSVDTGAEEIGRVAASWLVSDDAMPLAGTEILVPPRLVVRRSTRS